MSYALAVDAAEKIQRQVIISDETDTQTTIQRLCERIHQLEAVSILLSPDVVCCGKLVCALLACLLIEHSWPEYAVIKAA